MAGQAALAREQRLSDIQEEKHDSKTRRGLPGRNYLQRLQAFVTTPLTPNPSTPKETIPVRRARHAAPQQAHSLKIRVVSWNMHDSLPKGNVEEILGNVPPYIPTNKGLAAELPQFEEGPSHPYHIIVVAGQECPTVSGIPMGLAGFKLKDREDRKSKSGSSHHLPPNSHPSASPARSPKLGSRGLHRSPTLSVATSHHSQASTSGWSYILEDWFCRGVGNFHGAKPVISGDGEGQNGSSDLFGSSSPPKLGLTWDTDEQDSTSKIQGEDTTVAMGPYELLSKERLMGIYLAVFVHRDARPFVEGTSKDTVATGLMKGRIGNKGGVGISVKIAGSTLLFVNAHLAAHEDHVSMRVANFDRIKSELVLDAFLPSKDPRLLKEDITDRFDHTFLFGDLNFRLDISRLHADWLIAHEEFTQALKFDQLRGILDRKESFIGFQEANIDFPPTYKFDVLKTIKRTKSRKRFSLKERTKSLYEGREGNGEERSPETMYTQQNTSVLSSVVDDDPRDGTASRSISEGDVDTERGSVTTPSIEAKTRKKKNRYSEIGQGIKGIMNLPTAIKAKKALGKLRKRTSRQPSPGVKVTTKAKAETPTLEGAEELLVSSLAEPLVVAPTPRSEKSFPTDTSPPKAASLEERHLIPDPLPHSHSTGELLPISHVNGLHSTLDSLNSPVSVIKRHSANEAYTPGRSHSGKSEKPDDGGAVYDSSSKQRVPSWCDRILWKTTVILRSDSTNNPRRRSSLRLWSSNLMQSPFTPLKRSTSLSRAEVSAEIAEGDGAIPTTSASDLNGEGGGAQNLLAKLLPRNADAQTRMRKAKTIDVPPSTALNGIGNGIASPDVSSLERKVSDSQVNPPRQRSAPASAPLDSLSPRDDIHEEALPNSESLTPGSHPPELGNRAGYPKRWLLGLLGREPAQVVLAPPEEKVNIPPPKVIHRKGDVVCLEYGTLDDSAMRRLEGRSDHRPILGTFSVYV